MRCNVMHLIEDSEVNGCEAMLMRRRGASARAVKRFEASRVVRENIPTLRASDWPIASRVVPDHSPALRLVRGAVVDRGRVFRGSRRDSTDRVEVVTLPYRSGAEGAQQLGVAVQRGGGVVAEDAADHARGGPGGGGAGGES
eukprot:1195396-Prorocentrum_minimum.AAC.2